MDDPKVVPPVIDTPKEEPPKDVPPEIDNKEIHEASLEEIIGGKDEPKKEEPPKVEEPKKEEPPKIEPKKEEGVDFDPVKLKEEIADETSKKIVDALKPKEDKVDEELIAPWVKEKRGPKDYDEVADWTLHKKDILDGRKAVEDAKIAEADKVRTDEWNKKQIDNFNKYTDEQLKDLETAGKIKTPEDRRALFQAMLDTNVARGKEGKTPITSIKEIFYEHFTPPVKKEVPGGDAPVSPGASAPDSTEKVIDYKEVHGKSLIDILMGR